MTNIVSFPGLGLEFEMNRVAFSLFGHDIYWYGVIIAIGFLLAVIYGLWRAPRFSLDPDVGVDGILVVVPSAIVGPGSIISFSTRLCALTPTAPSACSGRWPYGKAGWPSTAA